MVQDWYQDKFHLKTKIIKAGINSESYISTITKIQQAWYFKVRCKVQISKGNRYEKVT